MHNTRDDPLINNRCCLVDKFWSPQVVTSQRFNTRLNTRRLKAHGAPADLLVVNA